MLTFVTKSYGPDLERCELLCRSIDALAPTERHWIVVDQRDRASFAHLDSGRRRIITTEELLPEPIRRLGLLGSASRNLWLGPGLRLVKGWIVQQLAKLEVARSVPDDLVLHMDSDVALVRPLDQVQLVDADGRAPLFRVPAAIEAPMSSHIRWHREAEKLLGTDEAPLPLPDYVGGAVLWRRDNVVALLDHIASRSGRSWMRTLASSSSFSEYILYGRFVEDVLGTESRHHPSSDGLCRCYWGSTPLEAAAVETLLDGIGPTEIAVMVSAKAGMPAAAYSAAIERRW